MVVYRIKKIGAVFSEQAMAAAQRFYAQWYGEKVIRSVID